MKWRKIIAVLLVLAMMSSFLLMTGCERKKTVESENQGKEKVETTKYYTADDYLENSIEGIMSCIMAGVDMIELDVVMTKDGVPMMIRNLCKMPS